MPTSNPRKPNPAFTLIEVLVSVAVFTILSTVLIANLRFKTPKNALTNGVDQVVSGFRQAQTATITGIKVGSISPAFGLYVSSQSGFKDQVIVFADSNRNQTYDDGIDEKNPQNCFSCGTYALPQNIEVSNIELADTISIDPLAIVFSATNTEELYFNGAPAAQNITITLTNTETTDTESVTIYYFSGQISR